MQQEGVAAAGDNALNGEATESVEPLPPNTSPLRLAMDIMAGNLGEGMYADIRHLQAHHLNELQELYVSRN